MPAAVSNPSGRGRGIVGPPLGGAGESQPVALPTFLVAQYPGAKDLPPTIVDDETPLSAQWTNYLGLLIEAIEAEVGPFPQDMTRAGVPLRNLKDLLGTAVMAGLSIPAGIGRAGPGRLYGVQQLRFRKLATEYAIVESGTITAPFAWPRTPPKQPLFFAIPEAPASGVLDLLHGPTIVRGHAWWVNANTIGYEYRGIHTQTSDPGGVGKRDPHVASGRSDQLIDTYAVIFYMLPDEDA